MPECPTCRKSLDTERGVKIHHNLKHGESIATETSECLECGKPFEYYPSEKDGKYCESCAKDVPWDWSYNDQGGADSPHWNREEVLCSNCGNALLVKQSKLKNNNNCCDPGCMAEYRRENWQGENHPLWRGGEIESYGHGWVKIRRKARERDNYKCQICGKDRDSIGYGPEVHHITPVREFDSVENAHTMNNVISLCPTCHSNAEHDNISREKLNRKT